MKPLDPAVIRAGDRALAHAASIIAGTPRVAPDFLYCAKPLPPEVRLVEGESIRK